MNSVSLGWLLTWSDVILALLAVGFYFLGFKRGKVKGAEEANFKRDWDYIMGKVSDPDL